MKDNHPIACEVCGSLFEYPHHYVSFGTHKYCKTCATLEMHLRGFEYELIWLDLKKRSK